MIVRAGRDALAALIVLAPVMALAGDGTFGVPASGVLTLPPPQAKTASLIPPDRAGLEKQRPVQRAQQTYSPAPASGAGRSRIVPPSEAPIHSPIVVPPKKKQFKAPVATVDPTYIGRVAEGVRSGEPQPRSTAPVAQVTAPVMAQGAAAEPKRGLFSMLRSRSAAAAAYEEHTSAPRSAPPQMTAAPMTARAQPKQGARIARDGTPCAQLRGVFTSPPECR